MEFKEKKKERTREREKKNPRNVLLTTENKLMVTRWEVGGAMGEIGDGD